MSALLRKEVRAILPYWAATLALIVAPHLLSRTGDQLSFLSYCLGCALLGGVSFGHELQHRTLPMLLSQPISRSAIWWTKMLTLAAALLTSTAVLAAVSSYFDATIVVGGERHRFLPFVALSVFCGGPLLTLLAGSALGGAILSVSVPGGCMTFAMIAHAVFPEINQSAVSSTLILVFCPVALVLSYLRWQTYQARRPRSPAVASWLFPKTSSARSGPLAALLRKELRLQYGTFALVVPLWTLFLVGGVLSHRRDGDWPAIASALTVIDLLVLPLIAGAVALGEERSLGVAGWQLTLPPSTRLQWIAKMLVTLPSSLLLGLVFPLLVMRPTPITETLLLLVVGHLLLTHLAIYAASLSNGTMPAILLALAFWTAAGVAVLDGDLLEKLGSTPNTAIAMATLLIALHAFAFSNYRRRDLHPRRLGLQGLTLSGLLVFFVSIS